MLKSISGSAAVAVAIGIALVLTAFSPARAVPVDVTFSIQLSIFSPTAGQNVINGPGTLTLRFANGTSLGHVSAGSLHVLGGTAMLTNTFTVGGGQVNITGYQFVNFPGSGMGTVNSLGAFTLNTVGHIQTGQVHCTGPACFIANFVPSVTVFLTSGPRLINITAGLFTAGFPSGGLASFQGLGTGGLTPASSVFGVTVTGQEIGRVVVPEPGTGVLLGLGLAGFGIAGGSWRARRRRR